MQENPGESVSCLSGVKRSEFDSGHPCPSPCGRTFGASISSVLKKFCRGPDFPSERTHPKGGFRGCLFFGYFLLTQAIPGLRPVGALKERPLRLSCRIVAPKESNNKYNGLDFSTCPIFCMRDIFVVFHAPLTLSLSPKGRGDQNI